MNENIIKEKSFAFALTIVKLYKYMCEEKREFALSKPLLRSGTSVGLMVREAESAETKQDFLHKMSAAKEEINKTIYWLSLLKETGYLESQHYKNINEDAVEIIKIITSVLKSGNQNSNN